MARQIEGCRVAVLATDGFEVSELVKPATALEGAGADVKVIAPKGPSIRGWNHTDWGDRAAVDLTLAEADADDFDALLLPGGVMSPDRLRMDEHAMRFVRAFADQRKPIAAICHGPWLLAEADLVDGRKVTSWPSLKTDLQNAGAKWVDEQVVTDGTIITSRRPADIPAFNRRIMEVFAKHTHPAHASHPR